MRCNNVGDQHTFQPREFTRPRGRRDRTKQPLLRCRTDGRASTPRQMLPCSGDELPRVGFFDPKNLSNFPVGITERLSEHIRRALSRRHPKGDGNSGGRAHENVESSSLGQ
jgi:hypothetical protein